MYTTAALLDIHRRTHDSIQGVLDALGALPPEEMTKEVAGFSYPTLATQVHHYLGAERYWFSVLSGDLNLDDDADQHGTVEALRGMREQVAETTRAMVAGWSDEEASAPRTITKWNGETAEVVPAHVLLRTQTHVYQHHGEIASMLRQLGHRFPSMLDFPLV